ncbi:sugar phosphate isomerase/epimerase family protein (plasmid) [Streptosporangium sp. CA-135522]|uniref:sugar phosphate isomerase/epimerase family protein n=1 Tax=Streptosporangium sp. CA-135522 TaxID=3240072 RepID=UPI003D92972F
MITPIGLYSISVRGLEVPGLLGWAASHGVPFIHLRGGPRGVDLAAQSTATVWQWRKAANGTGVPITGVTADVDLTDLLTGSAWARAQAAQQVARLAESAALLGAEWVRLLARTPLTGRQLAFAAQLPVLASSAVPLLVELHDSGWMEPDTFVGLVEMVDACPAVWLLADTAQLAAAMPVGAGAPAWVGLVLDQAKVVHLSDAGADLNTPGHALLGALVATRIDAGQRLEVALEWTGADRSPSACLARYWAATAWWAELAVALEPQ